MLRFRRHSHKVNFNQAAQAKWFLLMGDLLKVGFSLQRALTFTTVVMKRQRSTVLMINQRLMQGKSFADSLQPFVGPDLYYQLLLAEKHGELSHILNEIGTLLVTKQRQRQKLHRLLQYPLLLLFLLGLLMVGLSIYVFPELNSWQTGSVGAQWTRLKEISVFSLSFGVLAGGGWAVRAGFRWQRFNADQRAVWLCGLPVVGRCYRLYYGYYLSTTLATLLECGMSLKEILAVINQFAPRSLLRCLGQLLQDQLDSGSDVKALVSSRPYLPNELLILADKGTTVDQLGADLMALGKLHFQRLLVQLEELLSFVQPVIFIVIAVVIVALYLSILLPIYQSIQGVY
ncbi:ComG operon protein 2 [Limosilactobacillus antri DSM 16041]|uniref:ComG operon protein 2 n=1 Tax=Limosilactobacillus antri DSM 16041 TaxID=525309 RepID=A0ABR5NY69_9LACO|nr:ComG operon protein 2 [Limosilactobacillus antri DSM 16041]